MDQKKTIFATNISKMKKYIAGILFIALAGITAWVLLNRNVQSARTDLKDLVPPNASLIDHFILARNGEQLEIELVNGTWIVNGTDPARTDLVTVLMAALRRFEIVMPVPERYRDQITDRLVNSGTHVTLNSSGKTIRSFFIRYDTLGGSGTYAMSDLARKKMPRRIRIKGSPVDNLEVLFSTNKTAWLSQVLFGFSPSELLSVRVTYPGEPQHSYAIEINAQGTISLSEADGTKVDKSADSLALNDYLSFFSGVAYAKASEKLNLDEKDLFVYLKIGLVGNRKLEMKGYRYYLLPDGKVSAMQDKNRFIALLYPGGDTVLLSYPDLDPVLRSLADFQKK